MAHRNQASGPYSNPLTLRLNETNQMEDMWSEWPVEQLRRCLKLYPNLPLHLDLFFCQGFSVSFSAYGVVFTFILA